MITYPAEMLPIADGPADVIVETPSGQMIMVPMKEWDALVSQARYICEAPMGTVTIGDIDELRCRGKAFDTARKIAGKQ